jgi:hypothetical protein
MASAVVGLAATAAASRWSASQVGECHNRGSSCRKRFIVKQAEINHAKTPWQ